MLRKIILLVFILIALLVVTLVGAALFIDPDDYREELAARASEQLGREVRLDGPIEFTIFPWLALELHDVGVGNPKDFPEAPQLATIQRASASVRLLPLLTGNLEIGTVGVEDARFSVVTSRSGASNLDGLFESGEASAPSDQPTDISQVSTGPIEFRNVMLSLVDQGAGTRTEVELEELSLAPFAPGREVSIALAARVLDGDAELLSVSLDGQVNVAADLSRIAVSDWSLDFSGAGLEGTARGSLVFDPSASPMRVSLEPFELSMDAAGSDLSLTAEPSITATLGDVIRVNLPGALFDLDGEVLTLDGEATLGERISGRLDVSGERLDLTRMAAAGGSSEAGDAGEAAPGEADYSGMQALDLRLALDLGELKLTEGANLTDVTARARLVDGEMTLDPLSARLFGGRFDGSARVDFNQTPPAVTVTPRLEGIRVAELASMLTGQSPVDGAGDVSMDIRFSGFTPQAMLSSLNGSGDFAVAEGVLQGVDLQALIDQELTTDNLGNIARAFGGETRFNTLSGGMRIENGVVELPDFNLSASGYGATGRGRIDLGAGQVDYALMLDLGDDLTSQLPGALRRSTGGQIPLSIAGDLTRPTVRVDLAAIAQGVVREELGRRLLEALEDDDEEESAPQGSGDDSTSDDGDATESGDAEEAQADEGDRRRDAARSLLRGLLEDREEDAPEESGAEPQTAEESEEPAEEDSESDPPPAVD